MNKIEGNILNSYDGVVGKATLEYRTGIKKLCVHYDPFGLCNIIECLYCENCYYNITIENGEVLSNSNIELSAINDNYKEFEDDTHEILFYDYVPDINNLFNYLFSEESQFRIVRTRDKIVMNDHVKSQKKFVKKN